MAEREIDKARGNTAAQKEIRAYHEGAFQTEDPVTGEPRKDPLPEYVSQELPADGADATTPADTDYEASWNKDQLQSEVDRRGLTVKGTGENGNVLKADMVKALQKDDRK